MNFLAVIETQKVKSYLFASPYMRETRGASVLLDRLNRVEIRKVLDRYDPDDIRLVYLGGGSGRVLFRYEEQACEFRDMVLTRYQEVTRNASVVVEVVPRQNPKEPFAEWVRRGVALTQQTKSGRVQSIPLLAGRWIRNCSSCGFEPASAPPYYEHGQHWLCTACRIKRDEVNRLYESVKPGEERRRLLKHSSVLKVSYSKDFIFTTLAERCESRDFRVALPQDFDDIGLFALPANYMGFIYADGNSMGEVVKSLGRLFPQDEAACAAYTAFSEIVDRSTREAAVDAVLENVPTQSRRNGARYLPAEFVLAGGDDLMLAVPAHNALDVAVSFIEKYQEKTLSLQSEYVTDGRLPRPFASCGLTTSAGIVLAHCHYPVSDLMSLSAELMKMAKRKAAAIAGTESKHHQAINTGTLDFIVLNESGSESAKERRNREYATSLPSGRVCSLTQRPYTTFEARRFLATIREMKEAETPRSKLKALYPVLFKSPLQAQFEGLKVKERMKASGAYKEGGIWEKLLDALPCFPFVIGDHGNWSTFLSEIIELYDFVHKRKSELESFTTDAPNPNPGDR
jgi:hypothetical protein